MIKYGFPIGHVTADAPAGTVVDHSCVKTNLEGLLDYSYEPSLVEIAPASVQRTFRGYRRADGQVGIRNEIWVIPTVGCVNGICQEIVRRFQAELACASGGAAGLESAQQAKARPNAPGGGRDGAEGDVGRPGAAGVANGALRSERVRGQSPLTVVVFPHNYGCSQLGADHENTRTVLADMVHHPNAGGVLVVSLGCENNQLDAFRALVGPVDESRVRMFVCQQVEDEVEYGLQQLREIYAVCSQDEREDVPVSELRVGLKCGGSDGLSGITANPLLGVFSDWIVAQGGTTVLTEVPEMFGAETILMNRCQDRETFDQTVSLINDFKEYFMRQGMPVYENPSPGNKAGGISTLEEKSLGCTQKCGKSIVRGVLRYGERLRVKGLNLLSAPGNDLVASTALAASGCQIVLFTTGRGTPFGSFVPTMKISTNSALAALKPGWIDFNAGVLAEEETMESVSARFIETVLSVASGEEVNNEKNGIREIAIFKSGVTL
ncbi:MAG: UxaA family hydrolase [Bacteroidales bacterium]|nr:UxaA family hydrolase [Bacteroidales bacterium]